MTRFESLAIKTSVERWSSPRSGFGFSGADSDTAGCTNGGIGTPGAAAINSDLVAEGGSLSVRPAPRGRGGGALIVRPFVGVADIKLPPRPTHPERRHSSEDRLR